MSILAMATSTQAMISQLAAASGICWSRISLGLTRRVNQSAGFDATSSSCQKTLVWRLAPASKPRIKRPTMNIRDNSTKLFKITMANNIGSKIFQI